MNTFVQGSEVKPRNVKPNLVGDMLRSMMADALDGPAAAYWAKADRIKRGADNYPISFRIADAGPDGDPVPTAKKTINATVLWAARKRIINDDVGIHRSIAAQFVGPAENWDYDSEGIDALLQIALFGKVVYG